jgi:uncharacterized protein (TIGR02466 family)
MRELYKLFATPVFVYDFEDRELQEIQEGIEKHMVHMLAQSVASPWSDSIATTYDTKRNTDIEQFRLEHLALGIIKATVDYLHSIEYQGPELRLRNSWVNWYKKGGFAFDHIHPEARVCGVYYYQTSGTDGALRFNNPHDIQQMRGFPCDGALMPYDYVEPKVGRMVLWPSWLSHRVDPNCTDHERISINFTLV